MQLPRSWQAIILLYFATSLNATGVSAASPSVTADSQALRVVELFTSHGCSSCPSADALFGELIDAEPDLIALEFHVDYWNDLVYGEDGHWVDPFSDAAYSARQRAYATAKLEGQRGVFTPQIVVNGRIATVGSSRRQVTKALASPTSATAGVDIAQQDDHLTVTVSGVDVPQDDVDIILLRYRDRAVTEITGGENRHRTLTNHHIVTSMERLARASPQPMQPLPFDAPAEGHGCAVLVQSASLSTLYGAARCP